MLQNFLIPKYVHKKWNSMRLYEKYLAFGIEDITYSLTENVLISINGKKWNQTENNGNNWNNVTR